MKKISKIDKTALDLKGMPGAGPVVTLDQQEAEKFEASLSKEDKAHAKQLLKMGEDIAQSMVKLGSKYLELCRYIRSNKLAPRLVSFELAKTGLHKVRISEVNRVANAGEEVWAEIEGRMIGFNKALDLSRDSVKLLVAQEASIPVEAVAQQVDELEHRDAGGGIVKDAVKPEEKLEKAAERVLTLAEVLNLRKKSFTLGHGWTLTITYKKPEPEKPQLKEVKTPATPAATQ